MKQPRFEVGLFSIEHDAAADGKTEHAELGIGPPADTSLVVKVADHRRSEVVLRLAECRVLSAAPTVTVGVDDAIDPQLGEPRMTLGGNGSTN